jgi:4-amino-4-deoxy-L-arabinose transferase-like glycosyltransferase
MPPDERGERYARAALAAVFGVAIAQRVWNLTTIQPLNGFDAPAHMGYVLTILREHRLPHPTEGWSTFHPPLYYLAAGAVWGLLEPLGPSAVLYGIRGLGAAFGLVIALVAHRLVRRLGGSPEVAVVAAALALFVPCIATSATMEGNETFAAGLVALSLPSLLTLQAEPRDVRAALVAGLFAGLAAIAKFTGLAAIVACVVPFVRRDLDRAMVRAMACLGLVFALVAGPLYARNAFLTGSPVPMTRAGGPMHAAERAQMIGLRRILDYVTLHVDNFRRPSVFQQAGLPGSYRNRNPAMASVPGLLYASIWYDPFANRIPIAYHRDGIRSGPVLLALGVVPTLLVMAGFLIAVRRSMARRLRAAEAPLVVLSVAVVTVFLVHTWIAPSTASVKGSYLLPATPAAAVFFAGGVGLVRGRARRAALALSLGAAAAAAFVFTEGTLFWSEPLMAFMWQAWAQRLPGSHIDEAVRWLMSASVTAG